MPCAKIVMCRNLAACRASVAVMSSRTRLDARSMRPFRGMRVAAANVTVRQFLRSTDRGSPCTPHRLERRVALRPPPGRRAARLLAGATGAAMIGYAAYAATAWLRYGSPPAPDRDDADARL